ncbi:hypothetical protein GCM10020254_55060 [Streptomyces goshikiensis]
MWGEREERGGGAEPVEGEGRQPGDHGLVVAAPAGVQQGRVQPLLAGRGAGVEQEHPGQDLLPGPAGGVGGGDSVLAELGEAQDAGPAAGEVGEGEGRVVVHVAESPAARRRANPCYIFRRQIGTSPH